MMDDLTFEGMDIANLDAERSVIGGLLIDNNAIAACDLLTSSMFFSKSNADIYGAIVSLVRDGQAVDFLTVHEYLESRGLSDERGGLSDLASMAQGTPSSANIGRYVGMVRDSYVKRQLILIGQAITELATAKDGKSVEARQAEALKLVEGLVETSVDRKTEFTASESLRALITEMEWRMEHEGKLGGLTTGLKALDEKLDGLKSGELIVIGARPSMGKSALAELIARANAKKGLSVRVQSYEMTGAMWVGRGAAADQSIPYLNIKKALMTEDEWQKFAIYTNQSADWKLVIDEDTAELGAVILRARAQKRRHGLDLLIVDHLHLMPIPGKNPVQELGDITATLKRLAKELAIPVVLLAQLSRAPAGTGRAPTLSDLRGSGSIEQDADVVIFPHRPYYYDQDEPAGRAELHIAKHRNGEVGIIEAGWHGSFVRFQNSIAHDFNPPRVVSASEERQGEYL